MHKIKIVTIDILLLLMMLEEWPMMNHQIYVVCKYGITFYMFLKYGPFFLSLVKRNSRMIRPTILMLVFAVLSTVATIRYTDKLLWLVSTLMNALFWLSLFVVLFSCAVKSGTEHIYKVILTALIIVLFFNDSLILILPYNLHSPSEQYLIGNKFTVSYYHCVTMIIAKAYTHVYTGNNRGVVKRMPVILGIWAIVICATVHCTTGLLMSVLSLFLIILPQGLIKMVCNRLFVSAMLLIENVLIFGSAQLFTKPLVQSFFVNVLGKTADITGRFRIYAMVDSIIARRPLLGFGLNTATVLVTEVCGYGNAQNGIKQLLIEFGYIGTGVLLAALFMFVGKDDSTQKDAVELYIMLIALAFAATVEITLSTMFVFVVALVGAAHIYHDYTRRNS